IDFVRTWNTPRRFAKFRMWKHTAEHPFTYKYAIDKAINVERWEGSYPTYAYPAGLDENIRKKLEQMTDEELVPHLETLIVFSERERSFLQRSELTTILEWRRK